MPWPRSECPASHTHLEACKTGALLLLAPHCSPVEGAWLGWVRGCFAPLMGFAQTVLEQRCPDHICRVGNEGAPQVDCAGSDFGQSLFFFPFLVGGVPCGWLAGPALTLACSCALHRRAATLCSSLTLTGLLSPPVGGVRFVTTGSILSNGKENIFVQLELEGVKSSSSGTSSFLLLCHTAPRSCWLWLSDMGYKNNDYQG